MLAARQASPLAPRLSRMLTRLQPALEADLRALLGDDGLSTAPATLRDHGTDASYHPAVPPSAVAYPRTTEEVAALVRLCAATHTPVIPFGAGTSLEGHVAALRGGVTVDLSRHMTAVLSVDAEEGLAWVEAGCTREGLNAHLRDTGLFFSVDPGANATLGGMASTRASGTTAVRHGTMRDNVKAVTAVLPDGRVMRSGRPVRKSSAGYDLTALFVGAEGTLGVITELALRLHPVPEATAAAAVAFPDVRSAVETAVGVMALGVPVARIELADEVAIDAVNRYSKLDLEPAPTLFFEFHGSGAATEEAARAAGEVAAQHGGSGFAWAASPEERRRLWQARHSAYLAGLALRPGARGFPTDVCVPLSALTQAVTECRDIASRAGLLAPLVGHVGDSNFHLCLVLDPTDPAEMAAAEAAVDEMVRVAHRLGGTCSGEHGVGYGKLHHLQAEYAHGGEAAALDVMAAIKGALDPRGIMNPGKLGSAPAEMEGAAAAAARAAAAAAAAPPAAGGD